MERKASSGYEVEALLERRAVSSGYEVEVLLKKVTSGYELEVEALQLMERRVSSGY